MLTEQIEHYNQVFDLKDKYDICRLFHIDGHEIAWVKTMIDVQDRTRTFHQLVCECDFAEGITWEVDEKGIPHRFLGDIKPEDCISRQAAVYLRQRELAREYRAHFGEGAWIPGFINPNIFPDFVLDLIKRVKNGEMVGGDRVAARFWGGFFYTGTLSDITGISLDVVIREVRRMQEDQQIDLTGHVVREYQAPPEPAWEEAFRIESKGWTGIVKIPKHSNMAQHWRYDLYRPDGSVVFTDKDGATLLHPPLFGPDVSDVALAEEEISASLEDARQKESGQS